MSHSPPDPGNPYQSPAEAAVVVTPRSAANLQLLKLLRDFRSQILALGAVWIVFGGLSLAVGIGLSGRFARDLDAWPIWEMVAVAGLIWIALGVLVCCKQIWALYVALVLSYLSAIGNVVNFNLCVLALLIPVILQAHRVLGFAKELTRAGIPLTTKPKDLKIHFQAPTM